MGAKKTPGKLPLRFTQGDAYTLPLTFTLPSDLTGYTFDAQIRNEYTSSTSVDFAIDTTNAAAGVIVLSLTEAQTTAMAAVEHVWDLQWTPPGGKVRTILRGPVIVDPEVTR